MSDPSSPKVAQPEFSAQAVADGFWEVYHDDDCGETFSWFEGGGCPKCGFRPDMQSIAARRTGKLAADPTKETL